LTNSNSASSSKENVLADVILDWYVQLLVVSNAVSLISLLFNYY